MDIQRFITLRKYLYHLTDEQNLESILNDYKLKSTSSLVRLARIPDIDTFLRTRRVGHFSISRGTFKAVLRDQDPLYRNIVIKNLDGGWTFEDFVFSLNSRVFFWATEKDLQTHYKRYENQNEYPKILRVRSEDLFSINSNKPQFCRLNSGAPRCSSYYVEGAPPRGPRTFLDCNEYEGTPSSVREVTFVDYCQLPDQVWISNHPNAQFKKV